MHPRLNALIDLLPELHARFESMQSRSKELRRQSERDTARVEWYDGPHYTPCPFGLERLGLTPAAPRRDAPRARERAHTCRYGLTREGRICIEQEFTEFSDRAYEEFWTHASDRILTARYDYFEPDKALINVQTILLEHGPAGPRAAALIRHAQQGVAIEAYEYDEASPHRLRFVHASAREHDPSSPQHSWMTTRDEMSYAANGSLQGITRTWSGGQRERIYPRADQADDSSV